MQYYFLSFENLHNVFLLYVSFLQFASGAF